jgi:hypothetical protein
MDVSAVRLNSGKKKKKKKKKAQRRKNTCSKLNQVAKLFIAITVKCGFRGMGNNQCA